MFVPSSKKKSKISFRNIDINHRFLKRASKSEISLYKLSLFYVLTNGRYSKILKVLGFVLEIFSDIQKSTTKN